MESRVLKTLEFDKIKEIVSAYCTSSAGRSLMEQLVPVTVYEEVVRLLEETDEALAILRVRGNVPMGESTMSGRMPNERNWTEC